MGFASTYLESRALFGEIINEAPDDKTGIIIVIPAYNEPGITRLLDSLARCHEPQCKVEVLIIINAPAGASEESIENNRRTVANIKSWELRNKNCFFRLYTHFAGSPAISDWGVGHARKAGMDEAVRRFSVINNPEGTIVSLDADCQVEDNYFVALSNELLKKRDRTACSIYFEHPLSGDEFPPAIYNYITLYELHLRYLYQGLILTGFPYVFHTVGLAMAVKALKYVKAGGMNRRRAGEDFYFIQKLVAVGGYFCLNSTTVYPSPRASSRVPFGTGASISKLTEGDLPGLLTFNLLAFEELRCFFAMTGQLYQSEPYDLPAMYKLIPAGLKLVINEGEWKDKIAEIRNNTSGLTSFTKRFFGWFNLFRIIKYLNFVHTGFYDKNPVEVSASELLETMGIAIGPENPVRLLHYFREMEKSY
jgi:glycosyltransferase involved in cell wall biosynthesis